MQGITQPTRKVHPGKQIHQSGKEHIEMMYNLPIAFYTCDAEGTVQLFNDAALKLWGRKPEIGSDLWCGSWKIYNPDGSPLPSDSHPMAIVLKEGRSVHTEVLVERPDGTRRNIIHYPQPIYDSDGKITGAVNTLIDISEQAIARKIFEESAKQFRHLADMMPEKVWTADAHGSVNYFNKQWFDYTHLSFEELQDWGWKKTIHPDDWERNKQTWKYAIETGGDFQIEHRLLCHDGTYRWHLSRGLAQKDDHGAMLMWVATNTDIHEQRGLDEEKFLLEFAGGFANYKTGAEFFDSLVSYVAKKTGADYAFIGELTEKEKDHFTIKTISLAAKGKLVPNIEYPLPDGPCEQVIRGTVYSYPQHCKITFPKNQTLVQFNVEGYVGYPLFTSDGAAKGLIAVMHEKAITNSEYVTALLKIVGKRAEFEMERNVFRKTLLNANYELQMNVTELANTNTQLDRFAFVASHDLQEPLRKIRTFTGRLQREYNDVLPAEAKIYLSKIDGASSRMSNLVDDLLTYSRVANLENLFVPTDLNETLKNIVSDLELLLEQKNATIQNDVLPTILAIPLQMNQLFGNLISNAIKYAKDDVASVIRISSRMLSEKEIGMHSELNRRRAYCEIIFQDNGIGFDQKYEEQIFTIFKRLHGKTEYTGTGIGLALCKKIIENHHGEIFAEAKENEGAAFHVILPMSQPGE